MPKRSRAGTGRLVLHVLNRAVQDLTVFENTADYETFIRILNETAARVPMRLLAYALMPNHWHLVLWPPSDECLSPFMKWLTATHAQQWRSSHGTLGRGAVYQGRFKAIAVQHDRHLLRLCRYVERNAVRARVVARAEDWPWSSASPEAGGAGRPALAPWPIARPLDWHDQLNLPEPADVLSDIRRAIRVGRHYGTPSWRIEAAASLRWRSGLRRPGKPALVPAECALPSGPDDSVIPDGTGS